MPIVFEEVTGEVSPEPRGASEAPRAARNEREPADLEERLRAALARAMRRELRLSDQ